MTLPGLPSTRDHRRAQSYADVVWVVRAALISVVTAMLCSEDSGPQQHRHASVPCIGPGPSLVHLNKVLQGPG